MVVLHKIHIASDTAIFDIFNQNDKYSGCPNTGRPVFG